VEEEEEEKIPAIIVYCIMKLWLMKQWSPSSLNIILNPKQEGYIRKPPEYFWKWKKNWFHIQTLWTEMLLVWKIQMLQKIHTRYHS
jgi:hypothetical protein